MSNILFHRKKYKYMCTMDTAFTTYQHLHNQLHDLDLSFYSFEHFYEFQVKSPTKSSAKYINQNK